MALYRMVNGVKQYIDIDAGTVKFQDGDSFQDKLDEGVLKGETGDTGANGADGISPTVSVTKDGTVATISITDKNGAHSTTIEDGATGATGPQGPSGSDATVTRTNVINALGYTPSNSGLTQAEVEQMIQNNQSGDISVVQLPYKQFVTGTNTPPASNYDGIFTWAAKMDSSGKVRLEDIDNPGSYKTAEVVNNIFGGNLGANTTAFSGITFSSSAPGIGSAMAITQLGLCLKFKSSTSSYQHTSKTSEESASPWITLCDRYGVLGQAKSVAFLNYYDIGNVSNWKNFDITSFPFGLSTCMVHLTSDDKEGYYFTLVMRYGSENPNAKLGYTSYATEFTNAGMMIMFPFGNPAGVNNLMWFSFGYLNGDTSKVVCYNWSAVIPDVTGDRSQ